MAVFQRSQTHDNDVFCDKVADQLLGIPFVPSGRNPQKGLDCFGVVIEFYRLAFNLDLIDPVNETAYKKKDRLGNLIELKVSREWVPVETKWLQAGDLVALSLHGFCVDHVGIILSQGKILHSLSPVGCVRSRLIDYHESIRKFVRHRKRI